jgi:DNA mismatch endonuclease (patch repair protein)
MSVGHAPLASNDTVRRQMSRQRTRDTVPELALRRALHARGIRFRVHRRIAGCRPDVVLTRAKVAVFVMGDFWHSCPAHGTQPKSNSAWWSAKLASNSARDERQRAELENMGWHVEWVWECEETGAAAARVERLWRTRTGRATS